MNDVTNIKVSSDFWDYDGKGCSRVSKEDCSTRSYIVRVTEECGCLPLAIWTEEYHNKEHCNSIDLKHLNIQFQWKVCSPDELECVKMISVSDNDCLNSCEGLFITGFDRREYEPDEVKDIMSLVMEDYEFYKSGGNFTDPKKFGGIIQFI